MRRYWGTLAGLAVGLLGGVFGALFGLFIGFLVDLVWAEFRVHRATIGYLDGDAAPAWLPRQVALGGELLGHLQPYPRVDPAAVDRLAAELRPFHPERWARRQVERMIVAAATHSWSGIDVYAARLAAACPLDERERVVSAVWNAIGRAGATLPAREEVRAIARRVGIDEGFIARELVLRRFRDAEACAVLGIARDASRDEVRAAYRRLAAQFHPDTAATLSEQQRAATEQAFKRIQAAYETLLAEEGETGNARAPE
ncbi:MAG: J domain-containing protein [Spirochaetota bacterium]